MAEHRTESKDLGGASPFAPLATVQTDADKAAIWRQVLTERLLALCELMDQLHDDGFEAMFGLGRDGRGKQIIAQLSISKPF